MLIELQTVTDFMNIFNKLISKFHMLKMSFTLIIVLNCKFRVEISS